MENGRPRVAIFYCFMAVRSKAPARLAWGIRKRSPCKAPRARGTWANPRFGTVKVAWLNGHPYLSSDLSSQGKLGLDRNYVAPQNRTL